MKNDKKPICDPKISKFALLGFLIMGITFVPTNKKNS